MYGNLKYMWDMKDYKAIKRLLERLGFVHVAGWVRKEDAPAIRRKIEKTRPQVEALREWNATEPEREPDNRTDNPDNRLDGEREET